MGEVLSAKSNWILFQQVVTDHVNGDLALFRIALTRFAAELGWGEVLRVSDKSAFYALTAEVLAIESRRMHQAGRLRQLVDGQFGYWVYQRGATCIAGHRHTSFDRMVLPPDHRFWAIYFPANGWGCTCKVFGCRTLAGSERVGGSPQKQLPPEWDKTDPATGLPKELEEGFLGNVHPDLKAYLSMLGLRFSD
ncbi:MAG: hypothetical protein K0B16_14830 [Burkholderiaceae bacterium]|nr:hypothetical protein [Burkholderiaceae bacterium]